MKHKIWNPHFSKWLNQRLNFKMRLFLYFFIIVPPVLLIVSIGSYLGLSRSADGEMEKTLMTTMERLKNQVEQVISETENLSRNIIYNDDVQTLLAEAKAGEKYPSTLDAAYFINSFIVNRDYIESVVIMGEEETLFATEKAYTNVSSVRQIKKKWWYPLLDKETEPYVWYAQALDTSSPKVITENNVMLTRNIRSLSDHKTPVGRMMIYIKESYIQEIWEHIQYGETTNLWVVNTENEVVLRAVGKQDYSFLLEQVLEVDGPSFLSVEGKKYMVGNESFTNSDWKLLIAVPQSEVDSSLFMVKMQIALVAAIVLLIIVLIALSTAETMARPIKALAQAMDVYHGSIVEKKEYRLDEYSIRKDEVGVIYRSYQKLTERIETLIKEIYLKDLEKKDAELALLETQINPHFLYNTLDSINWMALANDQEEISEMVTALSDTFRLSLTKNSNSFVSLDQEMQYIEGYMTIQKFRYGDRLAYSYFVEEEARNLKVLRFILQPVVENGLKHGIDKIEAGGNIDITVKQENGNLHLTAINDGARIDLKKMEKLLVFDVNNTEYLSFESEGYGIQNINRRIKIMHGIAYGIRYEILKDKRTSCEIILPICRED